MTDGGDTEEECILQLRVLLHGLGRKHWGWHGCCEGTGDRPADRGRVHEQPDIGDSEFLGLNAVSFDVLNVGGFLSCRPNA